MYDKERVSSFKPRGWKSGGFLPLPATYKRRITEVKKSQVAMVILLVIFFLVGPKGILGGFFRGRSGEVYPDPHPLTSRHVIETNSKYIFPPIEYAPLLKELKIQNLVKESTVRDAKFPDVEKKIIFPLNKFDDPDPVKQKTKEDVENEKSNLARAKNYFKNQDKIVFSPKKPKNYPSVIIVTGLDFEKYSLDALTKIVQNRVDYAHKQSYGIYVRWFAEFLPVFNSMTDFKAKEKSKWARVYALRAAMFAFPHAKWFWYLDQDSFIMNDNLNLEEYILSPQALGPIMKREQPVVPPDGSIKTYKNMQHSSAKLIFTQSKRKIETTSFIVKNDVVSRGIIDAWGDPLYLHYSNFPYGPDSSATHILQWHPFILSKTTIIPSRTIASRHPKGSEKDDTFDYEDGDFVVLWDDCEGDNCENTLNQYHQKLSDSKKDK